MPSGQERSAPLLWAGPHTRPAGQSCGSVRPVEGQKLPSKQGVHVGSDWLWLFSKLPTGQGVGADEPSGQYDPAVQFNEGVIVPGSQ